MWKRKKMEKRRDYVLSQHLSHSENEVIYGPTNERRRREDIIE
jgi:hypothetical protein